MRGDPPELPRGLHSRNDSKSPKGPQTHTLGQHARTSHPSTRAGRRGANWGGRKEGEGSAVWVPTRLLGREGERSGPHSARGTEKRCPQARPAQWPERLPAGRRSGRTMRCASPTQTTPQAAGETQAVTHKGTPVRRPAGCSSEMLGAGRDRQKTFPVKRTEDPQPRFVCPERPAFGTEGQMQSCSDEEKLKDLIPSKPGPQRVVGGLL